MAISDDLESNVTSLIGDLKGLFSFKDKGAPIKPLGDNSPMPNAAPNSKPNELLGHDETYQAPIKGTFYNSGEFAPGYRSESHPTGHMGVDLRASLGTPLFSIADGIVTNVGTDPKGGNIVMIQHPHNVRSYYAHLGTVNVHKGEQVTKDTQLGTVGSSGNARGTHSHCHLQIWSNGQLVNPANFFSIPSYTNVDYSKEKNALPGAEEAAKNFSMLNHLKKQKTAFSKDLNQLEKIAEIFEAITAL